MWRHGSSLIVAFALGVASACGGGEATDNVDEGFDGAVTVEGATWSVAEVAPSVECFGDLAVVRSAPVTTTFDASAASLELDDSVSLDVPAGAFDAPTALTAVIVDLDFAPYADDAPQAAVYVLATETDVDLVAPVVLEVAEPPESVTVVRLIDGEWQLVDVPAGPTTRIPIPHFSEVPIVVAEAGTSSPVLKGPNPDGEAPGDFLTACLFALTILLGSDVLGDDEFGLGRPLAYSFCARALVTKFSPSGVRVEVSCVGDKIDGGVDFLAAIDACAAETDAAPVDDNGDSIPEPAVPRTTEGEPAGEGGQAEDETHRLTIALDLPGNESQARYDWVGGFRVEETGTIAGTGTVTGSSAGTCESTDGSGSISGSYAYTLTGTFAVAGSASGDQLQIHLADPTAEFTSQDGDRTITCVDFAADFALDVAKYPFGAPGTELGPIIVPAVGGSTSLDGGEGFVVTVEVTPL